MAVQQFSHETSAAELTIWTVRFGAREQVAIDAASLFTFVEPLPGLPGSRRFALIADAAFAPLHWLQSLDEWEICLPVLPLESVELPGYASDVATTVGSGSASGDGTRVLLVTHLGADTFAVNLLAPIVLDLQSATGHQLILDGAPKGGVPGPTHDAANGVTHVAANGAAAGAQNARRPSYALRQPIAWHAEARVFTPC